MSRFELHGIFTLSAAERETQIPRSTIRSAIDRGDLPDLRLGSGEQVVNLYDLKAWDATREVIG